MSTCSHYETTSGKERRGGCWQGNAQSHHSSQNYQAVSINSQLKVLFHRYASKKYSHLSGGLSVEVHLLDKASVALR